MALTPMMTQYFKIKGENEGSLLFYRLGDFYELFFEDAITASRELELTLTGKDCGLKERAPMCGVPYHSADSYIARLIDKGYHVAICEQMSDPAESKGLVDRAVTRVITPGTIIESNMLDERRPNYIASVYISSLKAGIAFCDVSTGEFKSFEFDDVSHKLADELSRLAAREIIVSDAEALKRYTQGAALPISSVEAQVFDYESAGEALISHFEGMTLSKLGLKKLPLATAASGALLKYLSATQKNALKHIHTLEIFRPERYMKLDSGVRVNLELTESLRTRARRGSLMGLIDRTVTSMGSRMLRSWIEQPLYLADDIDRRQSAVGRLREDALMRESLRDSLEPVRDIERLLSKIAYETVNARDCLAIAASLGAAPHICRLFSGEDGLLGDTAAEVPEVEDLVIMIEEAISPDAPLSVREGGIIREGYDPDLDRFRLAATDGKSWISALEQQEKESTGIKNLKIGYNRVFGFYIEVTKSYYDQVPMHYIRKQTLASCERFITQDLKELEKKVLGAEDEAVRLEYRLFVGIRAKLLDAICRISAVAQAIKTFDALGALAQAAAELDFVRPSINDDGVYDIKGGRHPVVEQSVGRESFVPNDTHMSREDRVMIITGPNMAGKSTYMRQVAIITLLAHVGSFVPAGSANIARTDRIFTRIGASDDLFGGQSTFMVEMSEMASILKNATRDSLLILDEVGRGTSTFDGLSIAWAAVEHIADIKKCGARTLFATHYHELSELEGKLNGVVNYRITVKERGDDIIFLRRIERGGADRSYGVAVAGLAGLPESLLSRARQIMARLEVDGQQRGSIGQSILDDKKGGGNRQVGFTDFQPMELIEEIRAMDVVSMTPIDALNTLYTISEKARRI